MRSSSLNRERVEFFAVALLSVAALLMTGVVAYDRLRPQSMVFGDLIVRREPEWKSAQGGGALLLGQRDASVEIVVFSDFYCPYCREFAKTLSMAAAEFPGDLRVAFRHFPVTVLHPDAKRMAIYGVCADRAGVFRELHDKVFEGSPESIPRSLEALAALLPGVDRVLLDACATSSMAELAVTEDSLLGARLRVAATPTVLVNGWRFSGLPKTPDFIALIEAVR